MDFTVNSNTAKIYFAKFCWHATIIVQFLLSRCFCASRMTTVALTLNSCICGYHVYKDIWDPPVGEIVVCQRENRNPRDPYAVALLKDSITVGNAPHVILCICVLFLRHGGIIRSTVTGPRRHSDDLPHRGLELPCKYQFIWPENIAKKAHQLLLDEQDGVSELQGMFIVAHLLVV